MGLRVTELACTPNIRPTTSCTVDRGMDKFYEHVMRESEVISGLLANDRDMTPLTATVLNGEKYLSFQVGNIRFTDSFQFLSTSLDNLVSLLLKSGRDKFIHTTKHLGDSDLVFTKGIYPYSYMTGPEKFAETQLPPIEAFYNTLEEESCPPKNYDRACEI